MKNQGNYLSLRYAFLSDVLTLSFRAKDAVAALIKRLAHRNANVQLYTLEVGLPYHPLSIMYIGVADFISYLASKCSGAELWSQDSSRAGVSELHGGVVATCQ